MTGPVEPSRPEGEREDDQTAAVSSGPDEPTSSAASDRPAPTGWQGRQDAPRQPGSYRLSAGPPGAGSSVTGAPVRPPVPTGVPPRPSPLPPPRPGGAAPAGSAAADLAGSLATATVVPDKVRRPAPRPSRPGAARGRRARLAVKRLDPWSTFVTSLVLSLLLAVVTIVAAFLLYSVLSSLGVPKSINNNIGDITKDPNLITRGKFVGIAALIAGANVIFLTALATIGAMLYNLVATFTGGLELTLSERE
ncbi:MAG: hypothetical protein JWP14_1277 [Frankiales bacterium]|nr:hypothetical protein [Frankiales bacterium]